jgi:hypothetical protein
MNAQRIARLCRLYGLPLPLAASLAALIWGEGHE